MWNSFNKQEPTIQLLQMLICEFATEYNKDGTCQGRGYDSSEMEASDEDSLMLLFILFLF